MLGLVTFLAILAFFGLVMAVLTRLAASARRRGLAGSALRSALMAHDEGLHGTAHDAHIEIQERSRRKSPMVAPDGPWPGNDRLAPGSSRVRSRSRRRWWRLQRR